MRTKNKSIWVFYYIVLLSGISCGGQSELRIDLFNPNINATAEDAKRWGFENQSNR